MSKRIFSSAEIKKLSNNKQVLRCSKRSITYSKSFKMDAVALHSQGFSSTEIFRQAGLEPDLIGKDQPKECMRRWNDAVRKRGVEGLSEARGKNSPGRPGTKHLSDADRIKRLEAKVAYLKAENDFLAELRAKRAE